MTSLTTREQARYTELNQVIGENLESFFAVGAAMLEVQKDKLYRGEYESFEAYCNGKWGIGRNYGYRLVSAAKVAENVGAYSRGRPEVVLPTGNSSRGRPEVEARPESERQIRPLKTLKSAAQQREAWQAAVTEAGGEQPTSYQVNAAVSSIIVKEIPQKYHRILEDLSENEQAAVWQWAKKLWPKGEVPMTRLAGEVAKRKGKPAQEAAGVRLVCLGCQNDTWHLSNAGVFVVTCARCGRPGPSLAAA